MSKDPGTGNGKRIWDQLTGDRAEFSMENRAFNYVCVITFIILFYCFLFDLYIAQAIMAWVIVALVIVLSILYYYSRFKKKFHTGILIYAACSYLALILNYYTNSGITGPTICLFFLTFQLLIAIGKPKQYKIWITLHLTIVLLLLLSEFLHPSWAPDTYPDRKDRFLDMAFSYVAVIAFIFSITNHLRKYYDSERKVAEERALTLSEQNKQIVVQNHSLEKADEEKNKLFSIISHDLKTPLDSIMGYLEVLSRQTLSDQEKTEMEDELLQQTKYTSDLLLNLLSWARAQMHGVTVNLTPIHLRDIVEKATSGKVSFAAKKGIKLTYSIDPGIEIIGDKDMLDIVVRNLVNNAIKFTNPGGEVFIKLYKGVNETGISIHDTGVGIPVEKRDEIFTLKTRSTYGTNNEKGIGLGLMMCKEFMEYQHGKIWFESKEGAGSVFYVTLPQTKI